MAIVIDRSAENKRAGLYVKDMRDGHAYQSKDGVIYICNRCAHIVAFSVDGDDILTNDEEMGGFEEINLRIIVE